VANFDDENGGKFLDMAAIIAEAPGGSHFYCCGPLPMLDAYRKATAALPPAQVHLEYFSAPTEAADVSGLTLELACSKKILTVPAGKTILEVVRAAGVSVVSSCEQGICGACETKVLSGIPDHRDTILSDAERAEGKTMMICCSGAKSDRLVLDL
jgi:ferredoxin